MTFEYFMTYMYAGVSAVVRFASSGTHRPISVACITVTTRHIIRRASLAQPPPDLPQGPNQYHSLLSLAVTYSSTGSPMVVPRMRC